MTWNKVNVKLLSMFCLQEANNNWVVFITITLSQEHQQMRQHHTWALHPGGARDQYSREWWIIVTVWAECEALALCSSRPSQQLEVIQWTPVLLELPNHSILGHSEGLIAGHTVEPHRLGLHQFDVTATLATPGTGTTCVSTPGRLGGKQHNSGDTTEQHTGFQQFWLQISATIKPHTQECKGILRYCHLDSGRPVADNGEKVTSNSSSMPWMFLTKYWNFSWKISIVCCNTELKSAFPRAIRLSCSSTALLMVGSTRSGSIWGQRQRVSRPQWRMEGDWCYWGWYIYRT